MSIKNSFIRASFSLVFVGAATLGACGDDGDDTGSDAGAESSSSSNTSGGNTRAGTSGTPRAGRGGAGGRSASEPGNGTAGTSTGAGGASTGTRGGAAGSGNGGSGGRRGLPPGAGGTSAAGTGASGTGTAGTAGIGAADDAGVSDLTDGQIAEFASSANTGETTLGMVAVTRAQTPAVRSFAQNMITAHNAAQERQTGVVNALGITAMPSPLSAQLSENAAAVLMQLQNASVPDFDILYMRSQVDVHMQVLQAIDEHLLPSVTADALRAELVLTRGEVQGHLESARAILATLEGIDLSDAGVAP